MKLSAAFSFALMFIIATTISLFCRSIGLSEEQSVYLSMFALSSVTLIAKGL